MNPGNLMMQNCARSVTIAQAMSESVSFLECCSLLRDMLDSLHDQQLHANGIASTIPEAAELTEGIERLQRSCHALQVLALERMPEGDRQGLVIPADGLVRI